MGGGNFVVPAQCVTDFLAETLSGTIILFLFKIVSLRFENCHIDFTFLLLDEILSTYQLRPYQHQVTGWG